jgi:hypothetical protein
MNEEEKYRLVLQRLQAEEKYHDLWLRIKEKHSKTRDVSNDLLEIYEQLFSNQPTQGGEHAGKTEKLAQESDGQKEGQPQPQARAGSAGQDRSTV